MKIQPLAGFILLLKWEVIVLVLPAHNLEHIAPVPSHSIGSIGNLSVVCFFILWDQRTLVLAMGSRVWDSYLWT